MFTPKTQGHTHSLRSKRNRQAAGDDALPTAKRKRRSALRRDTFEPLAEASINEVAGRAEAKTNGHIDSTAAKPAASKSNELTYRGPKGDRRSDRSQPATTLAVNDFYTVSELPALPLQVREFDRKSVPYSCVFSVEHGYALAITHSEAVIWPYSSTAPVPTSRDLVVVPLGFLQTSHSDPLPLAAFTRNSIDGEPGLLVVSAKWGKIIYWDTLTNASTILPGQESSGVQGSVPNMNGETVKELVNAEPAGFILSLSRGRVSHVSVRDQKGRPSIGVQNLNKAPTTGLIGAIGGSVRKMVGWSHRRGVPMVKAGAARKGQRDVLIMTENAEFELWETNITVGNISRLQGTVMDDLRRALQPYAPAEKTINQYDVHVLDIDVSSSGPDTLSDGQANHIPFLALVALADGNGQQLFLVDMVASDNEIEVTGAHSIRCYSPNTTEVQQWRPRLAIVKSTAFAIFETAVVLYSLSKVTESPSSQLLAEGHALPGPFQDVIQLDEDKAYRFIGNAVYADQEDATCLLAVSMKGLIRIQSHKNDSVVDADSYTNKIGAKSRIEQAVFFGTNRENPLNLNTAASTSFNEEDVEVAALQVSYEILTAESRYLPRNSTSITKHLQDRAKYLDSLVHYLLKHYHDKCSRQLRDQLLWNAEKVAAAQAVWKVQEGIQHHYPQESREQSQMEFALQALHESKQDYADAEKGQADRVRHFLLNNISNMGPFLGEVVDCIQELPHFDITDPKDIGEMTIEAVDLWSAAYSAAFKFREDNAAWYGFGDRVVKQGVFLEGYSDGIGEPWTSETWPKRRAMELLNHVCSFLDEWADYNPDTAKSKKKKMPVSSYGKEHAAPPKLLSNELISKLPKQVDLLIRVISEEIICATVEEYRAHGDSKSERILEIKAELQPRIAAVVERMAQFNIEGAIEIAEQLKDPYLLVNLTHERLQRLNLEALSHPDLAPKNEKKIMEIQEHAETYYETLGVRWALANFSRKMESGELGGLLNEAQENNGQKQSYLNNFLKRAKAAGQPVGKISWINDIRGEGNYQRAERTLVKVAEQDETDVWAKKTELCIAKLVGLAAEEERQATGSATHASKPYDDKIALIDIQERLAQHVNLVTGSAIDDKAAEDLAMNDLSAKLVAKSPGLKRLLRNAVSALIAEQPLSPDGLVDFLTLADPHDYEQEPENDPEILGQEIPLALKVVDLAHLPAVHSVALRQSIWRRAMIRDDWSELNKTLNKSDQDVQETMQMSNLFQSLLKVFYEAAQQDPNSIGTITEEGALGPPYEEVVNKILSPTRIVEQNAFPIVLQKRFDGAEKEAEAVKKDLEKEQATLKKYVEKAQLELHWSGLKENARQAVVDEFRRRAEEAAAAQVTEDVDDGALELDGEQ